MSDETKNEEFKKEELKMEMDNGVETRVEVINTQDDRETQNWKSDWTQSGTSKTYQQKHISDSKTINRFNSWDKNPQERNNTWNTNKPSDRNGSSNYRGGTVSRDRDRNDRTVSNNSRDRTVSRDRNGSNNSRDRNGSNNSRDRNGSNNSRDRTNNSRDRNGSNNSRDRNDRTVSRDRNKTDTDTSSDSQEITLIPTTVIITSEKGWKPRKYKTPETPEEKLEFHVRTGQGFLNKMTRTTFDRLSEKFVVIAKEDEKVPGTLKVLIDKIFEQALQQPSFCDLYADLCRNVNQEVVNFRNLLLTKCQEEFERDKISPDDDLISEEKARFNYKAKKRTLGNIKFIGELYKNNILVDPVIYECINKLLDQQTTIEPDEEKLEALANLLMNIGKSFDSDKTQHRLDKYFEKITTLQDGDVTSRIRFMIQDLKDLRERKWVPLRKK